MTSVRVQFVLIFAQPTQCSSVCCLRLPNNHKEQPVIEPEPMSLPHNHILKFRQLTVTILIILHVWQVQVNSGITSFTFKYRYIMSNWKIFCNCLAYSEYMNFIFYSPNVCFLKIRSKLSSVLLLCLLRIFMKQTLLSNLKYATI